MSTTELSITIGNFVAEVFSVAAKTIFGCFGKITDFVAVVILLNQYY